MTKLKFRRLNWQKMNPRGVFCILAKTITCRQTSPHSRSEEEVFSSNSHRLESTIVYGSSISSEQYFISLLLLVETSNNLIKLNLHKKQQFP